MTFSSDIVRSPASSIELSPFLSLSRAFPFLIISADVPVVSSAVFCASSFAFLAATAARDASRFLQ